ncbi:putative transmembrane sensor domain protein [Leptolyngbya sp. PCC 7375]|nr:putative transmembrane sensor domain protein [Leptolyngbya sp. PCC 7375]
MNNIIILKFGKGNLDSDFSEVTLQHFIEDKVTAQTEGYLPRPQKLLELFKEWQRLQNTLYKNSSFLSRIKIVDSQSSLTNISRIDFIDLSDKLRKELNQWLSSQGFSQINNLLRNRLSQSDEIRIFIETNDISIRKLPWHLWSFLEDYPRSEVILSATAFATSEHKSPKKLVALQKVRILAIVGHNSGLDISRDLQSLESLPDTDVVILIEPTRQKINDSIWDSSWDIIFFGGHSSTHENTGRIYINPQDSLTIDELEYAFRKAVLNGLKLAIFNSCDGLGLAHQLEELQIPHIIVMRELVPDKVAHTFLRSFLKSFSLGQSFHLSVREARERLQGVENEYPCASWLPVTCQNPTTPVLRWRALAESLEEVSCESKSIFGKLSNNSSTPIKFRFSLQRLRRIILASILLTTVVTGVRYLALIEPLERNFFDQMMRLRPQEPPDERLLIVKVTEEDVNNYGYPLRDSTLAKLLVKLEQSNPRVIGLDIFRDQPVGDGYEELTTQLQLNNKVIPICSSREGSNLNKPGIPSSHQIPISRLGFSDVIVDDDNILRRHLLSLTPEVGSPCTAELSLSFQVALHYLAKEGIQPDITSEENLTLGSSVIKPLESPSGVYQHFDDRGYQILLNYRSSQNVAESLTLTDILEGNNFSNLIKDRVVLVGVTAPTSGDYFSTPYSLSANSYQEISGILIHAQMVSQLISHVLDQRPILQIWPLWGEYLWIWGCAVLGVFCGFYPRSGLQMILGGVSICGTLYIVSFLLLSVQGSFIPFVPSVLSATGGYILIYSVTKNQKYYPQTLVHGGEK